MGGCCSSSFSPALYTSLHVCLYVQIYALVNWNWYIVSHLDHKQGITVEHYSNEVHKHKVTLYC